MTSKSDALASWRIREGAEVDEATDWALCETVADSAGVLGTQLREAIAALAWSTAVERAMRAFVSPPIAASYASWFVS